MPPPSLSPERAKVAKFYSARSRIIPPLPWQTFALPFSLVLAKNKTDNKVQFIDATGADFFKKGVNINLLTDDDDPENPGHLQKIMKMFDSKENVPHVAETVAYERIVESEYNLSVSAYVEPKDTRVVTDITKLNGELKATIAKINQLRSDIDTIVAEIEP